MAAAARLLRAAAPRVHALLLDRDAGTLTLPLTLTLTLTPTLPPTPTPTQVDRMTIGPPLLELLAASSEPLERMLEPVAAAAACADELIGALAPTPRTAPPRVGSRPQPGSAPS